MTVELITGFAGTPHIGSDDIGAFQAGIVGPGDYALATGNQLRATMSNANTIAVQSGDAVLNGRHVHLTGTTTATVQSGTQGQKRNDLAVLRYTKNTTTGVETCSIVVLKGTPTTGTPADPAHNTGSILDGVATHDMPLYRIPINGITVGTLVPLFNVLKPMKDVWDSLSPSTYIACGRTNEGVSALGAVSFKFPTGRPSWAAGRRPDSFVFSDDEQGNNNEIVQKRYMSRLWSLDANGGQFRILRSDTWSWINGGKYPVSWIATWNK
jgi:hypothetical protein